MANENTQSGIVTNLVREAELFAEKTGAGIEALAGEIVKLNVMYKGAIGQDHPLARPLVGQLLKPTLAPQSPKATKVTTATKAPSKATGKRVRRGPEELSKLGTSMVAFIKEGGKEGQLASAIRAKFPDIGPGSVKEFLQKWAGDAKVKSTGSKQSTRYAVA